MKLVSTIILGFLLFFNLFVSHGYAADKVTYWNPFAESEAYSWFYNVKVDYSQRPVVRIWAEALSKGQYGINEKVRLLKKFGGQTMGYEKYSYTMNLFEIDCAERKQRIAAIKDYDTQGKILAEVATNDQPWGPIPPGTVIEQLFTIVCSQK